MYEFEPTLIDSNDADSFANAAAENTENPEIDYLIYEDLVYCVEKNNSITIVSCNKSATEVKIPPVIDDKIVTTIGESAFKGCVNLKKVYIPYGITTIDGYAFKDCSNLTDINLPESITSLGYDTFINCSSLKKIVIPNSVKRIDGNVFENCTSLEEIVLHNDINYIYTDFINNTAYYNDPNNWENGVLYINQYLIVADKDITLCSIREGTTYIADSAFSYCSALTDVTIPEGVTKIDSYSFYYCRNLERISLPNSLEFIGYYALSDCEKLKSITIPSSVETLGYATVETPEFATSSYIFRGCSSLERIDVSPENNYFVSDNGILYSKGKTKLIAYPAAKSDKSYDMPNSVTIVEIYAFSDCKYLTNVTLSEGLVDANDIFEDCPNITNVTIPSSLTNLGVAPFYNCNSLKQIEVMPENTAYSSENGILYNYDKTAIIKYPPAKDEETFIIPSTVTKFNIFAFSYNKNLKDITIPSSIKSIANSAFYDCKNLAKLVISDGVESIENGAFMYCRKLSDITLPDSIKTIFSTSFAGTEYEYNPNNWDEDVLYLDNYLLSAKKNISLCNINPGTTYIVDGAFRGCKDLINVTIPSSVSRIGGYAFSSCTSLNNVVIPEGTEYIENYVFSGCTALENISLPTTLKEVGMNILYDTSYYNNDVNRVDGVFYAGPCLLEADIGIVFCDIRPETTVIAEGAFKGCSGLTNISISEGVTAIPEGAFKDCRGLMKITLPESLTDIGDRAFEGCTYLTSIMIPSGVENIGTNAFYFCGRLQRIDVSPDNKYYSSVDGVLFDHDKTTLIRYPNSKFTDFEIPSTVTKIGDWAFCDCSNVGGLSLPDGVNEIGEYAFFYCYNMKNISFGSKLKSIGANAFLFNASIKDIYFAGSQNDWNNITINYGNYSLLKNANVKYNYEISSGGYVSVTEYFPITVKVNLDYLTEEQRRDLSVFVGLYAENDSLLYSRLAEYNDKHYETTFYCDILAQYIKAFVWNNGDDLKPVTYDCIKVIKN